VIDHTMYVGAFNASTVRSLASLGMTACDVIKEFRHMHRELFQPLDCPAVGKSCAD
jgi:hypothetical protein